MPRWLAVGLGCVTALGLQALFAALLAQTGPGLAWLVGYVALFFALALAGARFIHANSLISRLVYPAA